MAERAWSRNEQIALSFDGQASPSIALRGQAQDQPALLPWTWGLAWYPDNQRAAAVLKDPDVPIGTPLAGFIEKYGQVRSSLFIGHSRGISEPGSQNDTQPFVKSYASRQWVFTNAGELTAELKTELSLDDSFDIAPVGAAPAEHAFSWILAQIRARGAKTIDEFGWGELQGLLGRLNTFGATSFVLSDGIDLVAYRDALDEVPLHYARLTPPHEDACLYGNAFLVDYDGPVDVTRTLMVLSTMPMRGRPTS